MQHAVPARARADRFNGPRPPPIDLEKQRCFLVNVQFCNEYEVISLTSKHRCLFGPDGGVIPETKKKKKQKKKEQAPVTVVAFAC